MRTNYFRAKLRFNFTRARVLSTRDFQDFKLRIQILFFLFICFILFFNIRGNSGYVTSRFRPAIDCFRNSPCALDLARCSVQLKRLFVAAACFITHYCCHNFYCVRQMLIVATSARRRGRSGNNLIDVQYYENHSHIYK